MPMAQAGAALPPCLAADGPSFVAQHKGDNNQTLCDAAAERWTPTKSKGEGDAPGDTIYVESDAPDAMMGWTLLMHTTLTDDAETARRLIWLGAAPAARSIRGFSALMWAKWHGADAVQGVCRELKGDQVDHLDGIDESGYKRLMRAVKNSRDDQASLSVLKKGAALMNHEPVVDGALDS